MPISTVTQLIDSINSILQPDISGYIRIWLETARLISEPWQSVDENRKIDFSVYLYDINLWQKGVKE